MRNREGIQERMRVYVCLKADSIYQWWMGFSRDMWVGRGNS